mgnify:FL=1
MKQSTFTKTRIALTISSILAVSVSTPLMAAEKSLVEQVNDEIEIIEVRGIKGSLVRSMNVKREMSGVVDAISAEEMGKFPDTNLAESLQRITGVSVSRSNGEGSQITVRGFGPDFNLITLNGRQMPGTGNSRSYSLENLSSDGVSALEVYKTARAENPSGGLGATVNIVTVKPLNSPGEKYSMSAKGIYDESNVEGDDFTPELSALYSNTFADETFGLAFSFSHQQRDFQQQSANIQGWQYQTDAQLPSLDAENIIDNRSADAAAGAFFPRDMNYGIANVERERTNANVTFQYAPLELDENGTVLYADLSGNDGSYTANRDTTQVDEKSLGFNVEWQANDELSLSFDYHSSESKTDNGKDQGLGSAGSLVFGSDQLINKTYDFRNGDIPQGIINWKNGSTTLAQSEIDSHFSQFTHSPGKAEVEQLQIDGTWENPYDFPLMHIKFGVARTEQTMGGSNAWSGLIGGFLFNPNYSAAFPDSMFNYNTTSGFLDQFSNGDSPIGAGYYYSFDFDEAVARSQAYLNQTLLGDDYFDTITDRRHLDQGSVSRSSVEENTNSIYLSSLWDFDVADLPVQINVGFRYEQTDVTSHVLQPIPTEVWWKGGSEWHTQNAPGDNTVYMVEADHDVFLPMIDIKVDLTDDIVARASWGKTISRAPLGALAGGRTLGASTRVNNRVGSEGNTDLNPYQSTNVDLSVEYYYAEGSYASVGYFKKDVKNFVSNLGVSTTIGDMRDIYQGPRWNQAVADLGGDPTSDQIFAQMQANGATLNAQGYIEPAADDPLMEWNITSPFNNSDDKKVDGFEVAVQHLFGESGFGFGANATFVDGDVEFDVDDITRVADIKDLEPQTPLTGLSDSANFQVFYEKDGLSVKLTYAWRDEYLIGVGQDQGSADAPPQFAKEFGQVDMSVNYDINENLTVFVEGVNLNNETEETFGRYEAQFLSARQYGSRYTLGVRYSFR